MVIGELTRRRLHLLETGYRERLLVNNRVLPRAPSQSRSPILNDDIIYVSKYEPLLIEADPSRRPGAIEFIQEQSFYNRTNFRDALKEFAILNNFD